MPSRKVEYTGIFIKERVRRDQWAVLLTRPADRSQLEAAGISRGQYEIACIGNASPEDIAPQCEYRFYGTWEDNTYAGQTTKQFKFSDFIRATPHSREGVIRYLTEAPNIGHATATALWNKFQSDAVRICRESPEIAAAAVGPRFSVEKAEEAAAHFRELQALENVTIELTDLLAGRGFPKGLARECIRAWGAHAPLIIQRNPYALMRFRGCGFAKTDKMYLALGLPAGKLKRQALCVWHSAASDSEGHTWHPIAKAEQHIKASVGGVDVQEVKAVGLARRHGIIVTRRDADGGLWFAEGKKARQEDYIARKVADAMLEESEWPQVSPAAVGAAGATPHQAEELSKATGGMIGILGGSPGTGKAQPLDAAILTPAGWTTMGAVKPGDLIIGGNGLPVKVVAVFPQGEKDVFRVTMSDGSSTECCEDHLWSTSAKGEQRHNTWTVKSLDRIRKTLVRKDRPDPQHRIPMVGPVEFQERASLPLDPYLLGLLLGDGCFRASQVTISNPEPFIISEVASRIPADCRLDRNGSDPIGWRISRRSDSAARNSVKSALVGLGIYNLKSVDKFIPDAYKFASVDTRLAVLQGLLDTDGYSDGHNVEYSTSSPRLADDVRFLVQSLGGRVTVTSRIPAYAYAGEQRLGALSYRIWVVLPQQFAPFRLPRKAERYIPRTKYPPRRRIASIEPAGRKQCQCISVDSADGLYVTDDFIVTHNTWLIAALVKEIIRKHGAGSVALCAPTGKAAVRLTEVMENYDVPLAAKTVHRLLGVLSVEDGGWTFARNERNPLPFQYLIVDEVSMMGSPLFSAFIGARGKGTHLLLVGDRNQLPPVEHGAPLRDMILAELPYGELREIKRNAGTIVRACASIRDNESFQTDDIIAPDDTENPRNLKLIPAGRDAAPTKIMDLIRKLRSSGMVDPVWDVQIAVAVNAKSNLSRKILNPQLQLELNPAGKTVEGSPFREGDKVIQLKNAFLKLIDPDFDADCNDKGEVFVANGEFGKVIEVHEKKTIVEFANPQRRVSIPRGAQEGDAEPSSGEEPEGSDKKSSGGSSGDLSLGYACTVHKLQGSECPIVIVCLDEYGGATGPYGVAKREWLFTAISRAKKLCFLVGKLSTAKAICRETALDKRKTFLRELIDHYRNQRMPSHGGLRSIFAKAEADDCICVPFNAPSGERLYFSVAANLEVRITLASLDDRRRVATIHANAEWTPVPDCPDAVWDFLFQLDQDPYGVLVPRAREYAKQTERCCFCHRELTDEVSKWHGYGRICAMKHGMPWTDDTSDERLFCGRCGENHHGGHEACADVKPDGSAAVVANVIDVASEPSGIETEPEPAELFG